MKASWQKQVLASIGYRELAMFEDAAHALEEIEPEDKTRSEVLYARLDIYLATKKWDMAAAVARYLVKVDPENPGAWDQPGLFSSTRREMRKSGCGRPSILIKTFGLWRSTTKTFDPCGIGSAA